MKTFALFLSLVGSVALGGDFVLKNAGTTQGSVISLNCQSDAGLTCARDAGAGGILSCNVASSVEPGCVAPMPQTFSGQKTFLSGTQNACVAHSSLTACNSGNAGLHQCCSTHGDTTVYCNGTSNVEGTGSAAAEQQLASIYVNGIPAGFVGGATLGPNAGWTINAITGFWGVGVGAGTLPITITSAAGSCICTVSCSSPASRTTCAGNCTVAAGDTITLTNTTTCTSDPYVGGNLMLMGYSQ